LNRFPIFIYINYDFYFLNISCTIFLVTHYLEKNEKHFPKTHSPLLAQNLQLTFICFCLHVNGFFYVQGAWKKLLKVVNFDIFSRILLKAFNPTHRLLLAQHLELAPSFCPIFMLVVVVVSDWNRCQKLILIFLLRILLDALSPTHSPLLPYNLEPSFHLFQSPYLFMALLLDVFEQGG